MASAAVTAALAAAALALLKISLGCFPAKGDSRKFAIEWLVLLIY
jgi:Spy/CpxP family protein refolding chaperone